MSCPLAVKTFFRHWGFALLLAAILIFFELAVTAVILRHTPTNSRWLGATIFNTGDVPVYLDYLAQAKNSFLLTNLFNNLHQIPRFDLFWSLGGLIVRLGLSPLWTHEVLRWACTLILALAVYATARAVTRTEKQARIASLLMIGGLSTGWLYDLWMGWTGQWTIHSPATADLASEFAIAPVLLGGAHMILSLALQLLAIRWIWEAIAQGRRSSPWSACLVLLALSLFHPYFIPLFGLVSVFALGLKIRHGQRTKPLLSFLCINGAMLPGALYYLWLTINDSSFRTHQFQNNLLPLDPWYFWLVMLLPFLPAAYFLLKRKIPEAYRPGRTAWVWLWLFAAAVCMLLPFPWTRKYTQGLLPVLVILTLPFWLMLADKLWTERVIWPLKICLVLLVLFPFVHLFQTQAFMVVDPYWSQSFYRSDALFKAWDFMERTSPSASLAITTDLWSNHWTPAYALRHVWIGHAHETPDFADRIAPYREWTQTADPDRFRSYLSSVPVTHVIATTAADVEKTKALIDPQDWRIVFETPGAAVWQKK